MAEPPKVAESQAAVTATISGEAIEIAPNDRSRVQIEVLRWLGAVLILFTIGEVAIGVSSWWHQDAQGLNAVREDAKSFILYILGVFSGVLGTHALTRGPK